MLWGMSQSAVGRQRWQGIIERHERSGLSIAAFCRRQCVPASSFFAWRRKLRSGGSAPAEAAFAEVRIAREPSAGGVVAPLPLAAPCVTTPRVTAPFVAASSPAARGIDAAASGVELRLSNGRSVLLRVGFDRRTLLDLLATLEGDHGQAAEPVNGAARRGPTDAAGAWEPRR